MPRNLYSKEYKSVTSFNYFTFFHVDINQSEVEDSFQLASNWIKSVRKNVNRLIAVTAATCRSEMTIKLKLS